MEYKPHHSMESRILEQSRKKDSVDVTKASMRPDEVRKQTATISEDEYPTSERQDWACYLMVATVVVIVAGVVAGVVAPTKTHKGELNGLQMTGSLRSAPQLSSYIARNHGSDHFPQ